MKIDTIFAIRIIFSTTTYFITHLNFNNYRKRDWYTLRNRQQYTHNFCSSCQFVKYNESIIHPLIITIIIGFHVHSKFKVKQLSFWGRNECYVFCLMYAASVVVVVVIVVIVAIMRLISWRSRNKHACVILPPSFITNTEGHILEFP